MKKINPEFIKTYTSRRPANTGALILCCSYAVMCVVLSGLCGCAALKGYSNKSLFPGNIKSVCLEMFDNQTFRRGIEYAREHGFDIIVILAGNNKDNPDEIIRLVRPIVEDGCDFVQGSRYLEGGPPYLEGG